jgi:hypothetical protein
MKNNHRRRLDKVFGQEASEIMTVSNNQNISLNHSGDKLLKNRNSKGHFIKGNTAAVGASGNPNPPNQFQIGNQTARTNGMFSKFFAPHQNMFNLVKFATLDDELALTRVRVQSNLLLTEKLKEEIRLAECDDNKKHLLDILWRMEGSIDVLIFRIESLTKTISKVGIEAAKRKIEEPNKTRSYI